MWDAMLETALTRIESLKTYYFSVVEKYENNLLRDGENRKFALETKAYLYLYSKVKSGLKPAQQEKFEQLKKEIGKYIEVDESLSADPSVLYYRIINQDELQQQGIRLDIDDAFKSVLDAFDKYEILNSSTLIMLMTRFEEFISSFLEKLFTKYPDKYLAGVEIPFSEIQDSSNFKELKNRIIREQVEVRMRESFKEWFKIFQEHKMNIEQYVNGMDTLSEIYARRNIWVHNSGYVNQTYIKLSKNCKNSCDEKMQIDKRYLSIAFSVIKKYMFIISIEACRLLDKDSVNTEIVNLFNLTFNCFCEKDYETSIAAFKCLENAKFITLEYKYMSIVNIWISLKEKGEIDCCRKEIEDFDTSALHAKFKMAKYLLLDKFEEADKIVKQLLEKNDIEFYHVKNWPLFIGYRKTEYYHTLQVEYDNEYSVEDLASANKLLNNDALQFMESSLAKPETSAEEQHEEECIQQ